MEFSSLSLYLQTPLEIKSSLISRIILIDPSISGTLTNFTIYVPVASASPNISL